MQDRFRSLRTILFKLLRTARQEFVSPWLRRHRTRLFQGYVATALLLFAILAFLANTSPYLGIDLEFTRELQSEIPPAFGLLLQAVSWPGYSIQAGVMILSVLVLLIVFGMRWEAVTVIFASALSGILNTALKVAIQRPRPSSDLVEVVQTLNSYSFPSGHVMFYVAFFGLLIFLTFVLLKNSWPRSLLILLLTTMIVLVGPSRMYLGEHWASDVIGAYLLGSLNLIIVIQFYQWGKRRFRTGQPGEPNANEKNPEQRQRDDARLFQTPIPITSMKDTAHEHHSDRTE